MAVIHEFDYVKPATLDETLSLLSRYGERACILAGGTDLVLKIKEGTAVPDLVIDIKGIHELQSLTYEHDALHIGALVSFTNLIDFSVASEKFPLLRDASETVGSVGIRNRATICGNICSAVPSLDSGPALLVYEAVAIVKHKNGERNISIQDWFLGPKKAALRTGELLAGISIPIPRCKVAGCYVKLGRYSGEDLAQAGVGILVSEDYEYHVAFCAVGPVPKRARKIEARLNGYELSESLLKEAASLVPEEISPISDIRASKTYRLLMAKVMLERGLKIAVSRLRGEHTEHGAIWV